MTEQLKKLTENGNRAILWEVVKLVLIPLITYLFMYYGSFVELKTQFMMFTQSYEKFEKDVKTHMGDRAIHK